MVNTQFRHYYNPAAIPNIPSRPQLHAIFNEDEKRILELIDRRDRVSWVVAIGGDWDTVTT